MMASVSKPLGKASSAKMRVRAKGYRCAGLEYAPFSLPATQRINQNNKRSLESNEGNDNRSVDSNPKDRGVLKFFEEDIEYDDAWMDDEMSDMDFKAPDTKLRSSKAIANEGSNQKRQTPVNIIEPSIIACMPFQKRSPAWKMVESTEAFEKIPQDPHFYPLAECSKVVREGTAIGLAVTYSNLFEEISALRLDDPRSVFITLLVNLEDLAKHGFDTTKLKCRIRDLLSTKDAGVKKQEELNDKIKEKTRVAQETEKKLTEMQIELNVLKAGLAQDACSLLLLAENAKSEFEKKVTTPWNLP